MQYDIKVNDEGVITLIPNKSNHKTTVTVFVDYGETGGHTRLVEFGKPISVRNGFFSNDKCDGCQAKEIHLTIRNH